MEVNYVVPLWSIIITLVPFLIGGIWALITMFFNAKATYRRVVALETMQKTYEITIVNLEKDHQDKTDTLKKDLEAKLDRHKTATDSKLSEMNNILVEIRTMVNLLMSDKIKK